MLLWVGLLPLEGLRAGWHWWVDPGEASSRGSCWHSWPGVVPYLPEWPSSMGPPGVPAWVTWPLYRPPTSMRKAGQRPFSSLQDPKAQRSYVTCPRPLSIVSGKGAARIQEFWVLVPLNTCYVAGPSLGSRSAKVCALKDVSQL